MTFSNHKQAISHRYDLFVLEVDLVKRLYTSQGLQAAFPEGHERLKQILEEQVYGFAPTAIIHKIALEFIFGTLPDTISRKNFLQVDTVPYAKEGRMQELIDQSFGK